MPLAALALMACAAAPSPVPTLIPPSPSALPTSTAPERVDAVPTEDSVERLGWLEGRWEHAGGIEHWARAGGVLWGVGFTVKDGATVFFEVLTVESRQGNVRYSAIPGGRTEVAFPLTEASESSAVFANPAHDSPKVIRYQREDARLTAQTEGGGPTQAFQWTRGAPGRADVLEAADLAFAADVAERGVDGWAAAFANDGAMWNRGRKARLEGDAIREAMAPLFAKGTRIEWSPVASGLSPASDIGYTIGTSRFTEPGQGGQRIEVHRGSYVTIWRRQVDGTWKVLFDTGN